MATRVAFTWIPRFATVLTGILLLAACGRQAERDAARQAAAELQRGLAGRAPAFVTAHHDGPRIWKTIRAFYAARRYQPAWIDGTRPRPQLDALLGAIDSAGTHGLDPELYDLGPLSEARSRVERRILRPSGFAADQVAPLDLRLTAAWLEYASDLANGVTDRPHADPMWKIKPREIDLLPVLNKAVDENRVAESLEDLCPANPEYRRLSEVHEKYRQIADAGGWPSLPGALTLRPGQRSAHLPVLVKRLAATGDLAGDPAQVPATYDARLQEAVRRFEARHGLPDSPSLTREAVAAMNVPVSTRIRQIELNMERWRWFPRDLGDRHIRVNVPEYHLEVWERGRTALSMKVIVGATDKPTPIFSDTMTTVVFAPFWNVPDSIANDETLPALMSDPDYLTRNNLEVVSTSGEVVDPSTIDWMQAQDGGTFPYRFRQRPGTTNSLGRVKFVFPNDFDVYLHDTPATALFQKNDRALSHGCVRVEQPVALAEYLLEGSERWDAPRIQAAMNSGEEQHVKLPHPIEVHLMYWTARVDEKGTVHFFNDIYGHDARQWAAYQARIARVKQKKAAIGRTADAWLPSPRATGASVSRRGVRPGGTAPAPRPAARANTASR